jgi:glutamate-1-semialdehyde 2,1-aminomutase
MDRVTEKSDAAFARAQKVLVGGVNSPVRSFSAVGGNPLFIAKAAGAKIVDVDDNEYIDYVASYGPTILGHAHQQVVTAVGKAVRNGTSFGAPSPTETQLAEAIAAAVESVEKVRFTNSGTEAVMTAIRLARGATGREKIIKFTGGYHGHCDAMLVSAGSGATTLGVPSSPGVPAGAVGDTILMPYNDSAAAERAFAEHDGQIAAVLVEPVAGNMGVIPPAKGFLPGLRELCDKNSALLIFDEVMTGFRVARGGAQELFGVRPDLSTFGKIIGGGMPVGSVAGPAEIMDHLAPVGPVYQAGTLSGNPAAMAAGLATLQILREDDFYEKLEATSAALEAGLRQTATSCGLAEEVCINRVGSMLCVFFTPGPVVDYAAATAANTEAFASWFGAMLDAGVYLPPSQYEAIFVSAAHTAENIHATVTAAEGAFPAAANILKNATKRR